jgi:squalene-hopene/tetraprenyl-beta-curcumene cyclase
MNAVRTLSLALTLALGSSLAACGDDAAGPETSKPGLPVEDASEAPVDTAGVDREAIVAAYDRGLDFLLAQQQGGMWMAGEHPNVGVTAMAVAAMYERPGGLRDQDKDVAEQALGNIVKALGEDGGIGGPLPNYMTSAVIMGLAAADRPDLKPQLVKAAAFLKKLQFLDEEDPSFGGIGYGSDKTRSDLSNTQYALASLRAAGVGEDDPVFKNAVKFLTRAQNRKENESAGEPSEWKDAESGAVLRRANDGGANYRPGDSKAGWDKLPDGTGRLRSYGSMTYALLRCYHLAGLSSDDGRVQAAVRWISENWDLSRNPGMPDEQALEGLYYYYATIGKTLPQAGIDVIEVPEGRKVDWRADLAAELLGRQAEDGSWVNENARWWEADPGLVTCYALIGLEACVK